MSSASQFKNSSFQRRITTERKHPRFESDMDLRFYEEFPSRGSPSRMQNKKVRETTGSCGHAFSFT